MIIPLHKGYLLNQQFTIIDVVGKGGNSYVYLARHQDMGLIIIKEYLYGHYDNYYENHLFRDELGYIKSANQDFFDLWQKKNKQLAQHEIQQFKRLREKGFAFYEASLVSFQQNHTFYLPILNSMGKTLDQYTIHNVEELYHYTLIILKAVAELHQKHLIHLDISLDNLLITPYDVAFLIDFGNMKDMNHIDYILSCKERYAPKEVRERIYYRDNIYYQSGPLGPWSDIYAIGKVMLELEDKCLNEEEFSQELYIFHQIALKACQDRYTKRYQSIEEMLVLLEKENEHLHYQRWKQREMILTKAEHLYREIIQGHQGSDPYDYRNRNAFFVGRELEQQKLLQFQEQKQFFSFITITAPAGTGKSSLVYHFISHQIYQMSNWKYIYLNGNELKNYQPFDLFYLGFDVMIVVDYIVGYDLDIAQFIEEAMVCQGPYHLRLIFIERGKKEQCYPQWMDQFKIYIHHFDDLINTYYAGNLFLHPLSCNELKCIIQDYIHSYNIDKIYQKLIAIDTIQRPIYALMIADMMQDNRPIKTEKDIFDYCINKEKQRIYQICYKENVSYQEWLRYYVIATFVEELDFENYEEDDIKLRNILQKLNTFDHGFSLVGLKPDLIGEYFIIDYFKNCRKSTISQLMKEMWKSHPRHVQRMLIHMEHDFALQYRYDLLNFDVLYFPYNHCRGYHDLIKELSLTDEFKIICEDILERYYEYYVIDEQLLEYNGSSKTLIIPDNVKVIGKLWGKNIPYIEKLMIGDHVMAITDHAFSYNQSLKEVICGQSLEKIGQKAFQNCCLLQNICFNEHLLEIGDEAFCQTSLKSLDLPSSLQSIGRKAFDHALDIHELIIQQNVSLIKNSAFSNCYIENLKFFCKMKNIPKKCFYKSHIQQVQLSNDIITIEEEAFAYNRFIKFQCPQSLKYIGKSAFSKTPIQMIDFNDGLLEIDKQAFMLNRLLDCKFPSSLQKIGADAFFGAINTQTLIIPGTVKTISYSAFNLTNIDSLILEEGVDSIEPYAFYHSSVKDIVFPRTLKSIGHYAFAYCQRIKEIQFFQDLDYLSDFAFYMCPFLKINTLNHINKKNDQPIEDDNLDVEELLQKEFDDLFDDLLADGITFEDQSMIFSSKDYHDEDILIIPKGIRKIEQLHHEVFGPYLYNPQEVIFNQQLEVIGEYAFDHTRIKTLILPQSVKTIENNAFDYCYQLTELILPHGLITIENNVISNTSIQKIELPSKLQSIGNMNRTSLIELSIPKQAHFSNYQSSISFNNQLQFISIYESNFDEFPVIKDNPQLQYVEVKTDKKWPNYQKINKICQFYHIPLSFTDTSYKLYAQGYDVMNTYKDFIENGYIFQIVDCF